MTDTVDTSLGELGYNRRESHFSLNVPRNIVDIVPYTEKDIYLPANLDLTQTYKDRVRGKYMIADFKYINNVNDYNFAVSYIATNYRLSYR